MLFRGSDATAADRRRNVQNTERNSQSELRDLQVETAIRLPRNLHFRQTIGMSFSVDAAKVTN
jgi:hypothetical protein